MKIEQFIVDVSAEHDWILAVLPVSFRSTRDIVRVRIEIRNDFDGMTVNIARLLPVTAFEKNGWLLLSDVTLPIDAIAIDFLENEQGITILFHAATLKATFTGLRHDAPTESPADNQGEFTVTNDTIHFTPREIILAHPEACHATLELASFPFGDVVHAEKTTFDRFPRCGCCGPKEEDFPLA